MISFLRGILRFKKSPLLTLDLHGVGYECQAPLSTFYLLPEVGQEVFLHTHFSVREDAQALYAFFHEHERALFRALIKVSNVGPKLALAILSAVEVDYFVHCIQEQKVQALIHIPGLGKKTAERLIVELQDRLKNWNYKSLEMQPLGAQSEQECRVQDAVSALVSLGFKSQEANRLIGLVKVTWHTTEELIRLALQGTIKAS